MVFTIYPTSLIRSTVAHSQTSSQNKLNLHLDLQTALKENMYIQESAIEKRNLVAFRSINGDFT